MEVEVEVMATIEASRESVMIVRQVEFEFSYGHTIK